MIDLLVTYLEMTAPPQRLALSVPTGGAKIDREVLDQTSYLPLYRAIGEPLQWDQRLRMPTSDLQAFLRSPTTHIFVLRIDEKAVGLCEFDGVGKPEIELT